MGEESKEDLVELARLAEQTERYEDMADYMKRVTKRGIPLHEDERNLLSVAYKNVVGARRSAWRVLAALEAKAKDKGVDTDLTKSYRESIENELDVKCTEVLDLIDTHLLDASHDDSSDDDTISQAKVFYLKMKGDYYRYLVEVAQGDKKDKFAECSHDAYEKAFKLSSERMSPTHPIRLGLALNYSVFFYEIKSNPSEACKFAQAAFDAAIHELDRLKEDTYKDSTLIMQLLRDNLTLWTSEDASEDVNEHKVGDK